MNTHPFADSGLVDALKRRLCATCEAPESNRHHTLPDTRKAHAEHRRRLGDTDTPEN